MAPVTVLRSTTASCVVVFRRARARGTPSPASGGDHRIYGRTHGGRKASPTGAGMAVQSRCGIAMRSISLVVL
jgi:hypothetical protein